MMMIPVIMMNRSQNKFIVKTNILIFFFHLQIRELPSEELRRQWIRGSPASRSSSSPRATAPVREGQAGAQEVQHPCGECRDPEDRE